MGLNNLHSLFQKLRRHLILRLFSGGVFYIIQEQIMRMFNQVFPEDGAITSLSLWHEYELKNTNTFNGMYQFWVIKE